MSKRRREKQDGNYNLTRTDNQLRSAKKMKVSTRSRLRFSRQETFPNTNDASSAYPSPGKSSKLLTGHSPICNTPRSRRQRLNTSRSDSETEIIWDANSPTAHLQRRLGRNGRSKVGEISEMIKCVKNQTETSPANMPLLGLWTHRSPLHQQELNAAGNSAFGEDGSNSKKPTHKKKKKKSSRLSLIQAELQKVANAVDMATRLEAPPPSHQQSSSQEMPSRHDPATLLNTPPRCSSPKISLDTFDSHSDDRGTSATRPGQDQEFAELKPSTKPVPHQLCHQSDTSLSVSWQSNIRQSVIHQPPIGQSVTGQSISCPSSTPGQSVTSSSAIIQSVTGQSISCPSSIPSQPVKNCSAIGQSVTGQSGKLGTSCSAIGKSSAFNVDVMWDDDSYFEDEALLKQLTQTEAMEVSKTGHVADKTTTPPDILNEDLSHNPANRSSKSLGQLHTFGVGNKACPESNRKTRQQRTRIFSGTVTFPKGPSLNTVTNQMQLNDRTTFKKVNNVKSTCHNQGMKQAPPALTLTVKPPPSTQVSKVSSAQPVQCVPNVRIQLQPPLGTVPAERCDAKATQARSQTGNCPQLRSVTNISGPNTNSAKPFSGTSVARNSLSNKTQHTMSISMTPSVTQEAWDNMDPFESSLTDEMMMSLCDGMDSPQSSKPSGHVTQVQVSKPPMVTKNTLAPSVDNPSRTQASRVQNKINSASESKLTTNSVAGSSSTTTFKFRKPVKDVSTTVTQISSKASLGKTSFNNPSTSQSFPNSTTNTVHSEHGNNMHQPIRAPSARHQLPVSSKSSIPSLKIQPTSSTVVKASGPSSYRDRPATSFYSKSVSSSAGYTTLAAHSGGSFHTTTSSSASTKPYGFSASTGGSHKVCSQTEIERKRRQAMARLQQHKTGSQQRPKQQH